MRHRITCPKCGARATSYTIYNIRGKRYVYVTHYSPRDKKMHKWYFGRVDSPETIQKLREYGLYGAPKKLELTSNELEQLKNVLASAEIDLIKKVQKHIQSARKVIILSYL